MEIVSLAASVPSAVGSYCIGVRHKGAWIVVDCGTPLEHIQAAVGREPLVAVIVTHAHNDHSSGLADLLTAYPACRCYLTETTAALLTRATTAEPPALAPLVEARATTVAMDAHWQVAMGDHTLEIRATPAGHLPGAISVTITPPNQAPVVITSDLGSCVQAVPVAPAPPTVQPSLLVLNTCAHGRTMAEATAANAAVMAQIRSTLETQSVVVLAPTVGLAQELLLAIHQARSVGQLPHCRVWTDVASAAIGAVFAKTGEISAAVQTLLDGQRSPWTGPPLRVVAQIHQVRPLLRGKPTLAVVGGGWLGAHVMTNGHPKTVLVPDWQDHQSLRTHRRVTLASYTPCQHATTEELCRLVTALNPTTVACIGPLLIDPVTKRRLQVAGGICAPLPGVRLVWRGDRWRGHPDDLCQHLAQQTNGVFSFRERHVDLVLPAAWDDAARRAVLGLLRRHNWSLRRRSTAATRTPGDAEQPAHQQTPLAHTAPVVSAVKPERDAAPRWRLPWCRRR